MTTAWWTPAVWRDEAEPAPGPLHGLAYVDYTRMRGLYVWLPFHLLVRYGRVFGYWFRFKVRPSSWEKLFQEMYRRGIRYGAEQARQRVLTEFIFDAAERILEDPNSEGRRDEVRRSLRRITRQIWMREQRPAASRSGDDRSAHGRDEIGQQP